MGFSRRCRPSLLSRLRGVWRWQWATHITRNVLAALIATAISIAVSEPIFLAKAADSASPESGRTDPNNYTKSIVTGSHFSRRLQDAASTVTTGTNGNGNTADSRSHRPRLHVITCATQLQNSFLSVLTASAEAHHINVEILGLSIVKFDFGDKINVVNERVWRRVPQPSGDGAGNLRSSTNASGGGCCSRVGRGMVLMVIVI
jgi:hypothetical protein